MPRPESTLDLRRLAVARVVIEPVGSINLRLQILSEPDEMRRELVTNCRDRAGLTSHCDTKGHEEDGGQARRAKGRSRNRAGWAFHVGKGA